MEKTTQIVIGGIQFLLSEAAYAKLESYLSRLKRHFTEDGDEIMRDIEARIAEKFQSAGRTVISEADVDGVIEDIGTPEQMEAPEQEILHEVRKRLYRDMENAWLGGVCAGLASYFDIDALWLRLAFLVSLFFGGAGIFVYVILWILVPEAKSASQKLEMRGHPVNLESIARIVKENVDEVRESGSIQRFIAAIGRVIRGFFRVLGKVFGSILVLSTFLTLIGLSIGAGIIATNWHAPYNDFPLRGAVSEGVLFAGLVAGYVAIVIPLIALLSLGIRLVLKRTIIPSAIAFGLIGIWAIAVSAAGTMAVKAGGEYYAYTETAPEYQTITRTLDLPSFSSLSNVDGLVTIRNGTSTGVTLEGREASLEMVAADVRDGTLFISEKKSPERMCIFCSRNSPSIIITVSNLDSVQVENGSIRFEEFVADSLSLTAQNALIRGELAVDTLAITSEDSSVRAELTSDSLTITSENSNFSLDGTASSSTISLRDSAFEGSSFEQQNLSLTTRDSFAEVNVLGNFTYEKESSSHVINISDDFDTR